jgi:hypothetical protein
MNSPALWHPAAIATWQQMAGFAAGLRGRRPRKTMFCSQLSKILANGGTFRFE